MNKADSYACKRLSEQIKFFGAKPKRFVSIYAKKPRIRLKIKDDTESTIIADTLLFNLGRRHREARQQALAAQGVGMSGLASQQAGMLQQAAMAQSMNLQRQALMQQQSMQVNVGMSNIGLANSRNSLASGLGAGYIGVGIYW